MQLIFIRHGETAGNPRGIIPPANDPNGLTNEGRRQVQLLVPRLGEYESEVIFSSPEKRAQETAEIIASSLGLTMHSLAGFRERDWGAWAGRQWEEVEAILKPMALEERFRFVPPKGESWQMVEERAHAALQHILGEPHERLAIVTHSGTLRVLIPILKEASRDVSFQYNFLNTSLTVFNYDKATKRFSEVLVNDVSHLQT